MCIRSKLVTAWLEGHGGAEYKKNAADADIEEYLEETFNLWAIEEYYELTTSNYLPAVLGYPEKDLKDEVILSECYYRRSQKKHPRNDFFVYQLSQCAAQIAQEINESQAEQIINKSPELKALDTPATISIAQELATKQAVNQKDIETLFSKYRAKKYKKFFSASTKEEFNRIIAGNLSRASLTQHGIGYNQPSLSKTRLDPAQQNPLPQSYHVQSPTTVYLDDALLKSKLGMVDIFKQQLKDINAVFDCKKSHPRYPCLILRIVDEELKGIFGEEGEQDVTNFLVHMCAGYMNHHLYKDTESFSLFWDKRQSFGFLTPTVSDTYWSVRLSFGVSEDKNVEWIKCCAKGLKAMLNDLASLNLKESREELKQLMSCKAGDRNLHKVITSLLIKDSKPDLLETLKILDDTKKLKQCIYSLSESLSEETSVLSEKSGKILAKLAGKTIDGPVNYNKSFQAASHQIVNALRANYKDEIKQVDYDSDSDGELVDTTQMPSKDSRVKHTKYITSCGMGALWIPLIASNYKANTKVRPLLYHVCKYAYFEVLDWDKEPNSKYKPVDALNDAHVVIMDDAPCINDFEEYTEFEEVCAQCEQSESISMLIVDVTSATHKRFADIITHWWQYREKFALVLVQSGLKHRQLGLDAFSYGEMRLLSNDQQLHQYFKELSEHSGGSYASWMRKKLKQDLQVGTGIRKIFKTLK